MSSSHHHQPDYVYLSLIAILIVFGLVMLSSAGSVLGFQHFGDSNYFLKKQAISLLVGLVLFAVTYSIDYQRWKKWTVQIMIGTIVLLLAVFIPGIGSSLLGAHRWINLGVTLFQPSELAKLTFLFYLAAWFERRNHLLGSAREGLVPFLITLGVVAGLVLLQPDLGTTIIIVLMSVSVYFTAGGSIKYLSWVATGGVALLLLAVKVSPYRAQRLTVFLNPSIDPQGSGYHISQSLLAIGSGGWFGLGLGHSRQKFNYLPEPAGDSIFAVTAEELGFIFVVLFILIWLFLIFRGLRIARNAPDQFGRLLAIGITVWLGFQAFLNIAALSGLMPLTGIPLPFMSQGGSALIISLAAVGVIMNISRQTVRSTKRI